MMCGIGSIHSGMSRHMDRYHPAMKALISINKDLPGKYAIQPGSSTQPLRPLAKNWPEYRNGSGLVIDKVNLIQIVYENMTNEDF